MIKTKLTASAAAFTTQLLAGAIGRDGRAAIDHYHDVAAQMDTEDEVCAAYLQDALEDDSVTPEKLLGMGMSEQVVEALQEMVHPVEESFTDYVLRIKENPLAAKVKRAEFEYWADETHYISFTGTDRRRRTSFLQGIELLDGKAEPVVASAPKPPAPPAFAR